MSSRSNKQRGPIAAGGMSQSPLPARLLLLLLLCALTAPRTTTAQRGPSTLFDSIAGALANIVNIASDTLPSSCRNEWQLVMCSDVPAEDVAGLEDCCAANAGRRGGSSGGAGAGAGGLPRPSAPTGEQASGFSIARGDLSKEGTVGAPIDWKFGQCTAKRLAPIPTFTLLPNGTTQVRNVRHAVPLLRPAVIAAVKRAARAAGPEAAAKTARYLRDVAASREPNAAAASAAAAAEEGQGDEVAVAQPRRRLQLPGGYAGADELALLRARLAAGAPLQKAAKESLLTGRGVPPKYAAKNGWHPPTGLDTDNYGGPYPMKTFKTDWGGWAVDRFNTCPRNYPQDAPLTQCGHYALVELDASTAYRAAAAYAATGDARHAELAQRVVLAWARANREFGLPERNGPLEAAWAAASMARALELLRATWPDLDPTAVDTFVAWANAALLPQMDYYVDTLNPSLLRGRAAARGSLWFGNWPASIADAYMALGILAGDAARYDKGVALYKATVDAYFRVGRGANSGRAAKGRAFGEATETLRDVYHTLFGLGSLLQAAETAWGQDEDLFAERAYVLAAAMELHARLINAYEAGDRAQLPPGFRFFEDMPAPPKGCGGWAFDIYGQKWASKGGDGRVCKELRADEGYKYLLGVKYLPAGFEIGYNHYAGRLGLKLPETAKLLRRHPVDWHGFCWGLGTLTHADTARELWRAGLSEKTLCAAGRLPPAQQEQQQQQQAEPQKPEQPKPAPQQQKPPAPQKPAAPEKKPVQPPQQQKPAAKPQQKPPQQQQKPAAPEKKPQPPPQPPQKKPVVDQPKPSPLLEIPLHPWLVKPVAAIEAAKARPS